MKYPIKGNVVVFLTSAIVIFSCHSSNEPTAQGKREIGNWTLETVDHIKIPIDTLTPNVSHIKNEGFEVDGKSYAAIVDYTNNCINIYDLKEKRLFKRTKIEKEGVNGIGNLFGCYAINFDSILLRGTPPKTLMLVDTSGKFKSKVEINLPGKDMSRDMYLNINNKPMIIGHHVFGFLNPSLNKRMKIMNLNDLPFYTKDLTKSSAEIITNAHFPAVYTRKDNWMNWQYEAATCKFENQVAFGFPISDSIYVYNFDTKQTTSHWVPSVEGFIPPKPTKVDQKTFASDMVESSKAAYVNYMLLYDKFNKVFYRFVLHPISDDSEYSFYSRVFCNKPLTVQIIDASTFKLMGERNFGKLETFFNDCFITSEGLYISDNNSENMHTSEDSLSYMVLKIKKA